MLMPIRFNARPITAGFALVTDDGVTKGYVTSVKKDMLNKWYVTTAGVITVSLGEDQIIQNRGK